ncbi:MAG: hypothetical protein R2867_16060 [Caldilineaceae bacterium]
MAPEALATRILTAIEDNTDEILVGGSEVWGVYLNRFVPDSTNGLFDAERLHDHARIMGEP